MARHRAPRPERRQDSAEDPTGADSAELEVPTNRPEAANEPAKAPKAPQVPDHEPAIGEPAHPLPSMLTEPQGGEMVKVIYEGNLSGTLLLSGNRAMHAGHPFEISRLELTQLQERLPWHRFHEVVD